MWRSSPRARGNNLGWRCDGSLNFTVVLTSIRIILQFPPPIGTHSAFPEEIVAKTSRRSDGEEEDNVYKTSECFEASWVYEKAFFCFIKTQHLDEQVEETTKSTSTNSSATTRTFATTPPQFSSLSRESDENDRFGKSIESLRGFRKGFRQQLRLNKPILLDTVKFHYRPDGYPSFSLPQNFYSYIATAAPDAAPGPILTNHRAAFIDTPLQCASLYQIKAFFCILASTQNQPNGSVTDLANARRRNQQRFTEVRNRERNSSAEEDGKFSSRAKLQFALQKSTMRT